jgi:hypothetical protein
VEDRLLVLKNNAIAIAGIFVLRVRTEQCVAHLCVCMRALTESKARAVFEES